MISKLAETFRLFGRHLGLFAAIILTVWLPGNLLSVYLNFHAAVPGGQDSILGAKLTLMIQGIFSPICDGALVYALFEIKSGRPITCRAALAVGLRKWGALFWARLVAGILTVLGFIALLVPGVILMVRYSFIDAVVVLEGRDVSESRRRSVELTAGRRWQILGAGGLGFLAYLALSVVVYTPLEFFDTAKLMPIAVAADSLMSVTYAIIPIVLFLYYWDATEVQRAAASGGLAKLPEGWARCAECGGDFQTEDMVCHGGIHVCAHCKPVLLQKLREGVAPGGAYEGQSGSVGRESQ